MSRLVVSRCASIPRLGRTKPSTSTDTSSLIHVTAPTTGTITNITTTRCDHAHPSPFGIRPHTRTGILFSPSPSRSPVRTYLAPAVARHTDYAQLTAADLSYFRDKLGDAGIITDTDQLKAFNTDWMKKFQGQSKLVLRPNSTQQISDILSYCNKRKLAVVPQGGNTGLVGGSIPLYDEIILSLSRMNKILDFDEYSGIVTVESGVILEFLSQYLDERGFVMPLDLGAKGSCHVGGNVSTNAGGLRYVRYGSLHGSVLGLEAVLADGTVLDTMSTLRKDNTGYDLKQLFIGAEGTLGVVSKISILAPRKPKCVNVAFLGVSSYDHVLATMNKARSDLLEIVSAIEFLDRGSMELVNKYLGHRDPLDSPYPFYMLIETSGSNAEHDQAKLQAFLESAMEKGILQDGTVAQDKTQATELWKLRETITEALAKAGTVYKYDISLPVKTMYAMVDTMRTRLSGTPAQVVGYGHLGDGNLHLNVWTPTYDKEVADKIEPYLFEQTALERGSVSAEHGLGQSKARYISYSKSPTAIHIMHQVKQLFDPNHILNPYKVLERPAKGKEPLAAQIIH